MKLTTPKTPTTPAPTLREPSADLFRSDGLVVDLKPGLATDEIERRLALAVRAGEACNRALAFYLAELDERRLYQALGYPNAIAFAQQRLQMRRSRAYELLSTGRRLAELPQIDAAFRDGEVSWSKARCIVRVATVDTEQAWIESARSKSQEQVEAMVSAVDRGDLPPKGGEGPRKATFVMKVTLDPLVHEMLEVAREKLKAETGREITDGDLVREAVALILGSDADGTVPGRKRVDGSLFRIAVRGPADGSVSEAAQDDAVVVSEPQLEAIASDARVKRAMRRRVLERDGYRCQACGSRAALMIHHVVWHSRGGKTTPSNLLATCELCHGLLHEQYLFLSGVPGRFEFTDRRGRRLDLPIAHPGVQVRVDSTVAKSTAAQSTVVDCAPAAAAAGGGDEEPRLDSLDSLDDIPDEIDAAWYRRHEHLLEWSRDGKTLRLKTPRRRR